jgi:hypothetical protein
MFSIVRLLTYATYYLILVISLGSFINLILIFGTCHSRVGAPNLVGSSNRFTPEPLSNQASFSELAGLFVR